MPAIPETQADNKKNYRHERCGPDGIGLDTPENETHIAVQHAGHRNADGRQKFDNFVVQFKRPLRKIIAGKRQQGINEFHQPLVLMFEFYQGGTVNKQDFKQQDDTVKGIDIPKTGHGRRGARREHDVEVSFRTAKMQQQRQRGKGQKSQGEQ